ncbi:hypothetical protein JL722_11991 [Aureococcus anophagefferens]|nr:hypothetical protein JL722_11991 [Aureococcus anophagefferens]
MESVREESAREDQMERVREVAAGEGEKETECSVAEGTSSTLIFCGTWSTGDDRDDGLPERQREPGSAAKRKRGVYAEDATHELVFPDFVICHTWPVVFNFRPADWKNVYVAVWDDGRLSAEIDYDFVNTSSIDRGGDGVCLRVHAADYGKVPGGVPRPRRASSAFDRSTSATDASQVPGPATHLQVYFWNEFAAFYKNTCPLWNDALDACPFWPPSASQMPDSFEVLVDGEDDAHVGVPTNAINNVFITPTKYVNLRGDVDIELLFSPVTQSYVVVPDVTLGDAQPTYFWFNYPSRHMMVHRKYAQRSLSELYAILFAILSTVAFIFSFFLYTEGDMNPGKFIIRKECVDEVCAATGAIPGDDGDDEEAAAFCGGPSDARSDDVEARSDDVDAASIEASAA